MQHADLSNLTALNFPEGSLQNIGNDFMSNTKLTSLTELTFPDGSLQNVGERILFVTNLSSLTTLAFPEDSLQTAGSALLALTDLSSLTELVLPDNSLQSVGDLFMASAKITNLNTFSIPCSAFSTSVGSSTFLNISAPTTLTVSSSNDVATRAGGTWSSLFPSTTINFVDACSGAPAVYDCSLVTDVTEDECRAVVDMYDSTAGESWTINTNWKQNTEVCSWYGVTCIDSKIISISFEPGQTYYGDTTYTGTVNERPEVSNNLVGDLTFNEGGLPYLSTTIYDEGIWKGGYGLRLNEPGITSITFNTDSMKGTPGYLFESSSFINATDINFRPGAFPD